jgi:hypothetical protein
VEGAARFEEHATGREAAVLNISPGDNVNVSERSEICSYVWTMIANFFLLCVMSRQRFPLCL